MPMVYIGIFLNLYALYTEDIRKKNLFYEIGPVDGPVDGDAMRCQ